ncbi:MAG: spermidine synthase [Armatimonadota bacterium]
METQAKESQGRFVRIVPLWVLVFFTGWFVMQTELVGARTLTPFFGNSIFVWGSVIAVFLLALAAGYGAGGRMTRRYSSHWVPTAVLVGAGVLVGLSATYQNALNNALAGAGMDARWGALVASIILYGPPMVLAGMIAPYSVHLATSARAEAGSRAGTLYAVSTLGSFIGSLATSFILIPSYSLNTVALGGGAVAAAAAIVTGIALSTPGKAAAWLSIVFAAVCVILMTHSPRRFGTATQDVFQRTMIGEKLSDAAPSTLPQRLAEGQKMADAERRKYAGSKGQQVLLNIETPYQRVQVTQQGELRLLTFGEAGFKMPQTSMDLRDITYNSTEYSALLMAPLLYKQDMRRALVIGLGGGDVARRIETCYPDIVMDVVEIDPAVVRIAKKYFFWKPSRNVTAYTMDGRTFLGLHIARHRKPYDWIVLDAFDDDYVPFHLTTVEFCSVLKRALSPNGVLAINTWIHHELYGYQARTVQAVFGQVDAYFGHRSGNVILVAQNNASRPMTPERALAARKKIKLPPGAAVDLRYVASCLLPKPNWNPRGDILTDTWAPVERLIGSR